MKFNPAYERFLREALDGGIGLVGGVRASFGIPFAPVESGRWSAELRSSRLPSGWTPLELVKHLRYVELRWLEWGFEGRDVGDPWGDREGDRPGPRRSLRNRSRFFRIR